LEQTIPKMGAAGFLQPGTGQSWSGARLRFAGTVDNAIATGCFGGRPTLFGAGRPIAVAIADRMRSMVLASMATWSSSTNSETMAPMLIMGRQY
jgi:hypothetical protein